MCSNGDSHKIFELVYVKYVLSMSGLILKIVAAFVQKVGLIWRQGGFFLRSNIQLAEYSAGPSAEYSAEEALVFTAL